MNRVIEDRKVHTGYPEQGRGAMFGLGKLIAEHRWWVIAVSLVVAEVVGVIGVGTVGALSLNRFEAPGSESMEAKEVLGREFGAGSPNVALLVTARDGDVDASSVAAAGIALTRELEAYPGVGDAWSYWTRDETSTLRSVDGRQALILAWAPGDADHVRSEVLPGLVPEFTRSDEEIEVSVGGGDEVFRVVAEQAREDFFRAEMVILPLVLLLLWGVYRRLSAALITLAMGVFAIVGALALLRGFLPFTEVSTFAANVILVMGLGLGVDYGLFVTYRFREELRRGLPVPDAVARTVATAGRTVVFSGVTVAAAVSVLLAFPYPFLRSFAYAGVAVVLSALFAAVIVLPALLAILGRRVERRRPVAPDARGFWTGVVTRVMRRPVLLGGAALAVIVLLGAPVLGIQFGLPDDRVLPARSAPVREMYDDIRANFVAEEADAVQVIAQAAPADVGRYAARLSRIEGVARVDSAAGSYVDGSEIGQQNTDLFTSGDSTRLSVVPTIERLETDAVGLVREVRETPAPAEVIVGGYPAELADYRDGVTDRLLLVVGLLAVVTFVVLFLMTGSVVAPVKATVLNILSLSVMFGALVWIFQEGNLSWLLGFTPTGTIEPSIPILMFCIAYGLSMDYEVFLLSRIKEEYDRTGDNLSSVATGIQRSAPLITTAAAILALSFATYATGQVVFLQMLGIGIALAIVVDATLIRAVLVPAFMRLAGRANWWAPRPLRRLHERIGLSE